VRYIVMSKSYSDNQKEVDKIDIFVLDNASMIAQKIWAEDMHITSVNILNKCLEHIQIVNFLIPLNLTSILYRSVFHGVVTHMILDENNFHYPDHFFNRTEY
jgi:hypothetical protein